MAFGGFEAEGAVSGTLGENPKLAGKIESNEFDPRALLASVGIAPPKTTDAQALGKVRFAASWAFDAGAIGIDPFTLDARRHALHRQLSVAPRATMPWANLRCAATRSNIARYIPPTDPASEPFVLPTAALKALLFRGSVELEQRHARRHRHEGRHAAPAARRARSAQRGQAARGDAMKAHAKRIAPRLLAWHAKSGRHDLPWQRDLQ